MLFWVYIVLIGAATWVQLLCILRGLYYLKVEFPRRLRPAFQANHADRGAPVPAVSVFVPCKGLSRELEDNIDAMLRQDYPHYRLFYITESGADPAAPLLAATASQNDRFHHVIAGHTSRCCQKNHNLLKGIDHAEGQGMAGEIYLFADMDIRPAGDWLSNMTLPLADQTVFAVSGFRSLDPGGGGFPEHLHAAFNGLQGMAMTETRYAGMWGGSMALKRKAFEEYEVYEKWSTAVVDDMSLTAIIKKHGLKRVFSPDCLVHSKELYPQLNQVLDWLVRQTQYAAVYLRPYTAFGLCLNSILLAGSLMLPVALVLTALSTVSWAFFAYHGVLYILIAASISLLSNFGKQNKFELRWLLYAPCFLVLGTGCGWVGFLSRRLVWANIVYHVNQRGEVLLVER